MAKGKDPIKTLDWLIKDAEAKAARIVDETITEMIQVLQTEHLTGGTSPTSLAHRTGKLARGTTPIKAMVKGAKVIGAIRSSEKYTRVHFGPRGTKVKIVPKHSKYLAIPTEYAKTAAGVPRGRPLDNIWGPTFIKGGVIFGYSGGTLRASESTRPIPPIEQLKQLPKDSLDAVMHSLLVTTIWASEKKQDHASSILKELFKSIAEVQSFNPSNPYIQFLIRRFVLKRISDQA